MLRPWLFLALMVGLSGCVYVVPGPPCAEAPQPGLGLEPGDRVLARWGKGFWDATVISVQGRLVTVAWDVPPPATSQLPRGWVEKQGMDLGAHAVGEWLLCKQEIWEFCRMDARSGDQVQVTFATDGSSSELHADEVAGVPEDVRAWAKRRAEAQLDRATLSVTVNPAAPQNAGTTPTLGQKVVARWSDRNWYLGTAGVLGEKTITVDWDDGSPALPVARADVAPLPEAPPVLTRGEIVFCKWTKSSRWYPARVEAVGAAKLAIIYRDGSTDEVGLGDCLPAQ